MNRTPRLFGGSMTALATPFKDGRIDERAFVRLCQRQIERGTTALVTCGSTGEAAALSPDEQAALIRMAVVAAGGQIPVIAGCGGSCTEAAASIAQLAAACGATALLCAPTPYVKPSQDGIIAHMRVLAHAADLPLIAYDVPSRAGVAIRDETVATLFERGLIAGIKDATADLARPPRLRALCGPAFLQFSGDDATAAAYRATGGHGCISVTANVAPSLCASMHLAWDKGDLATFAHGRDLLAPLHDALFTESNPVPLKAALALLNLATSEVRLPLLRATEATKEKLAEAMAPIMSQEEWLSSHPRYALAS
ncbi:4-hydroxy-tetrahydrodipicolinate synthase [Acidisphaera sp. S103]|uniref:4-hydroxy-tetrahydrodipicolinate synthase n=1 Tax=Acidisphaera sp. S103 TaxID=1747223 RepID=UPI00131C91B4|nr:4-hydroxy-tetrahydrodipicolinate synthase [Acidisphaera sp. S103]